MNQESKQDLCDSITEQVTKLCRQKLTESPDFKMDAVVKLSVGGEDFVIQITKHVNNEEAEEKNDEPEEIGAVMIKNEVLDNSIFEKENEEDGEKTPTKKIRPEVKMHKCEECEETFTSHAKLRKHRIAQHKQRAFECSECGKTFNKRSVLDRHLIIHEPVKNFSCAVCSKQFRDQRSLDEHSSVHTGEKPFQCPHCSRFFRLKKNMRLHMRIHTGERPYLCALCAKSFRRSEDFRAHMHTHNRDQRFTCEVCGNAFGYRASLRRHMKAHNTEKAFSCEYCGKSFHRRDRLNGHLRVHTGEKPYQCDECGKCFKERTHLRTHCRLLHSDDAQKKNKRNYSVAQPNPQILDRIQAVHVVEQDKSGVTRLKPIEITTSNTGEEVYGQPVTVTYTQMKKDNSVSEVAVNETPLQITTDYTSANLHYQCGGCGYMYSSKSEFEQHVQQCMGISQASLTVSDQVLLLQQIGN